MSRRTSKKFSVLMAASCWHVLIAARHSLLTRAVRQARFAARAGSYRRCHAPLRRAPHPAAASDPAAIEQRLFEIHQLPQLRGTAGKFPLAAENQPKGQLGVG
jgi:hypothetical protein